MPDVRISLWSQLCFGMVYLSDNAVQIPRSYHCRLNYSCNSKTKFKAMFSWRAHGIFYYRPFWLSLLFLLPWAAVSIACNYEPRLSGLLRYVTLRTPSHSLTLITWHALPDGRVFFDGLKVAHGALYFELKTVWKFNIDSFGWNEICREWFLDGLYKTPISFQKPF